MRRALTLNLALIVMLSSLGHRVAAAFCAREGQRDHCGRAAPVIVSEHAGCHAGMMNVELDGDAETAVGAEAPAISDSVADSIMPPFETCPHCIGHSGPVNASLRFAVVSDPSRKELDSTPPLAARLLVGHISTILQRGAPMQHAPPLAKASLHLIGILLI